MTYLASNKPITLPELARMKREGEKIAMLTCYDASFAALEDRCGVDVMLVGDSLGNYHESREQAIRNAGKLLAVGAEMVKLEGGEVMAETVHFMVERGVPVCAHIGLTPQSVHALGGYRVQGRDDASASRMKREARALEEAGAALMVLEMVPAALAGEITRQLTACATIGIGAGRDCDGQVLVLHDMLGLYPGKKGRFVRDFMAEAQSIEGAVKAYVAAVKDGSYPGPEHSY